MLAMRCFIVRQDSHHNSCALHAARVQAKDLSMEQSLTWTPKRPGRLQSWQYAVRCVRSLRS